jgi:hypothetical protein
MRKKAVMSSPISPRLIPNSAMSIGDSEDAELLMKFSTK